MDRIKIKEQKIYDVIIGNKISEIELKKATVGYEQVAFFIDDKVQIEPEIINQQLCYYFTAAEEQKNLLEYQKMIEFLLENNIQRKKSLIIAIGGGVTLDLVGYVAATYKRGVDVLYVPTTILAMVDVAVGSKNTINIGKTKNAVGTFKAPQKVIVDLEYLKTLDQRNYNNGIAEVIKHGAIKEISIIDTLLEENYNLQKVIFQSLLVKKYFIEQDNYDYGIRQSLNFGHTIGHALEAHYNYKKYLHGEAVAIGMNTVFKNDKLKLVCEKFDLPTEMDDISLTELMPLMKNDKKNEANQIKIINLIKLGEVNEKLQDISES